MSHFFLPEELLPNIWLRLPIKSTVRFRCVSKSWRASLSDLHFIYTNLTFSEAANEHDLLLLVNMERPHYSVVSHETLLPTPLQVPPEVPVPGSYRRHVLSPPCDDLVCFYDSSKFSIGLWNLTTGETKMAPDLVFDNDEYLFEFVTLGFGFDEKRKEYKIVQILHHLGNFVGYVYSMSSRNNCWRKVGEPNMPYDKDFEPDDVYSRCYRDGTFFWGLYDLIVYFNMSTEVFNTISIPLLDGCSLVALSYGIQEMCKLKEGSMFVIISRANFESCRVVCELWALLEVGVSQSWTKLLVIDGCGEDYDRFGFWRNELILRSYNSPRFLISDPFKLEMKEVHMDEPCDISRCLVWRKGKKNTSINF